MKFIFTEKELKKAIYYIISTLTQKIPYPLDRDDILTILWLDYNVLLPFKNVYSIVTDIIIEISDKNLKA